MPATQARPKMSQSEFEQLRKVIYDRAGIHFPDAKQYVLESRLLHRLTELELEDFGQYIAFLTMGPYQSDEFQEMFNRITINETSFFRNEPQLDVFETRVLPELLKARESKKRLRLWSAACSTGEEPYTLAMQVHRSLGLRLKDWQVEILGTDISERALNVAQEGYYTDYALRSTPALIKSRYFKQEGNRWLLDEGIRKMVSFEVHNLKDRFAAKRHGIWDVVFCRNVMIYFDQEMQKQVAMMFADQIAPDGALFTGHSENFRSVTDKFEALPIPQAFCFRPVGASAARVA